MFKAINPAIHEEQRAKFDIPFNNGYHSNKDFHGRQIKPQVIYLAMMNHAGVKGRAKNKNSKCS